MFSGYTSQTTVDWLMEDRSSITYHRGVIITFPIASPAIELKQKWKTTKCLEKKSSGKKTQTKTAFLPAASVNEVKRLPDHLSSGLISVCAREEKMLIIATARSRWKIRQENTDFSSPFPWTNPPKLIFILKIVSFSLSLFCSPI